MYTAGPAQRIRALLELCRPAVDEIFVAVDETGDPETLRACSKLADRVVRIGPRFIEELLGWMMLECRGDWTLRLDGDEVPSPELLDSLRDLVDDPFPASIRLPRRWLFPDTKSYISTWPWEPDTQVRLVRRLPGLWRIPGSRHSTVEMPGDERLVDLPLYHLDLVVNSRADRERKAVQYESERPGHSNLGFPVNDMYVPERHEVQTEPVPANASQAIERVLTGSRVPARTPRAPRIPKPSTLVFAESRPVDLQALEAQVTWVRPPAKLAAGTITEHQLIVENVGDEWWPRGDGEPAIRLGYRFIEPRTEVVRAEGRALLTETVRPGQTTRLIVALQAPAKPGEYALEVGLLLERVRWCECKRLSVTVEH